MVNRRSWRNVGNRCRLIRSVMILGRMNQDQAFRAALVAILLLTLPIGAYRRLKSQSTSEKLDRGQEGLFILATLRPVGMALWLGLIVWIVDPVWMRWSSVFLPTWLRWTGVGMIAIACGLLLWTLRCLGKNLTDTVVTRQRHTLVVHMAPIAGSGIPSTILPGCLWWRFP